MAAHSLKPPIPFVFWFSALLASSLATVMYDVYTPVAHLLKPRGKTKILGSICANLRNLIREWYSSEVFFK